MGRGFAMVDNRQRYDVISDEHGVHIDYHFCREWDGDVGCHGTNPDHGFTFEEAQEQIAEWHEEKAKRVRKTTQEEWEQTAFV